MNSKRILFLLLTVIVAGATALLARAWLQAERAAIAAQMNNVRPAVAAAAPAKPALQVLVARNALRAWPSHQARRSAVAGVAARLAACDLHC